MSETPGQNQPEASTIDDASQPSPTAEPNSAAPLIIDVGNASRGYISLCDEMMQEPDRSVFQLSRSNDESVWNKAIYGSPGSGMSFGMSLHIANQMRNSRKWKAEPSKVKKHPSSQLLTSLLRRI